MAENKPKTSLEDIEDKLKVLRAKRDKIVALQNKKTRAKENQQKIILGGMMLGIGREGPEEAKKLLASIEKRVLRDSDKLALESVILELKKIVSTPKEAGKLSSPEVPKSEKALS